MCGVAGYAISGTADASKDDVWLTNTINHMRHRGPDANGFESHCNDQFSIGLGHCRLSIQGLGSSGNQPMNKGQFSIIYNGEIYNANELKHEYPSAVDGLETDSDTELLLALMSEIGLEALSRVRGIYAFAFFDHSSAQLTIARDTFGVKPMYFGTSGERFFFASEPLQVAKALGSDVLQIDEESLARYLALGRYDGIDKTFYKGVKSLGPGEHLVVDLAEGPMHLDRRRDRQIAPSQKHESLAFAEAVERFRSLLFQSVERNFTSDVPVGLALSGGIDSSSLACVARYLYPDASIPVFSYFAQSPDINESEAVVALSKRLNLELFSVEISPENVLEAQDEFISRQGEPVSSSRIFAQFSVFQAAHKQGIKVLLEGQGADEVLAGYHGFAHMRTLRILKEAGLTRAISFANSWRRSNTGYTLATLFAMSFQARFPRLRGSFYVQSWSRVFLNHDYGMRDMNASVARAALQREYPLHVISPNFRLKAALEEATYQSYLPQLLRQGDRNAMAHSIENRVPYLDEDLVEFAWSLPEEFLLSRRGATKHILRESMRGLVPDSILDNKRKIGFETDPILSMNIDDPETVRRHLSSKLLWRPDSKFGESWRARNTLLWLESIQKEL